MNKFYASFLLTHIQRIHKMRLPLRIQAPFQVLHSAINQAEQNNQIIPDEAFTLLRRLDFVRRQRLFQIALKAKLC